MQIAQIIQQLRDKQQYRSMECFPAAGGLLLPAASELTRSLLSFSANDYLNLSRHPNVQEAAIYALRHYGCSAASSRLLSGHLEVHRELEEQLALWSGYYEAALCFGSGYLANCGLLQAVIEPNALVLFDKLNHASLVDGLRLAQATQSSLRSLRSLQGQRLEWQRYKHCNMPDLENKLQTARIKDARRPIWLVTDSLFSMDGDIAPLWQLAQLAERYQFRWIIDEAHAVGIYGPTGAGLHQVLGTLARIRKSQPQRPQAQGPNEGQNGDLRLPDFVTANLAKALGSYGGYCLCSAEWKDYLVNFCRSLIYSTGLPPASAAAAIAAIQIVRRESQNPPGTRAKAPPPIMAADWLSQSAASKPLAQGLGRELLHRSSRFYRQLQTLPLPAAALLPWQSPIVPVILGENQPTLAASAQLREHGIVVKAIRSPTVPAGKARLRFSLSLAHTEANLQYCAERIAEFAPAIPPKQ